MAKLVVEGPDGVAEEDLLAVVVVVPRTLINHGDLDAAASMAGEAASEAAKKAVYEAGGQIYV